MPDPTPAPGTITDDSGNTTALRQVGGGVTNADDKGMAFANMWVGGGNKVDGGPATTQAPIVDRTTPPPSSTLAPVTMAPLGGGGGGFDARAGNSASDTGSTIGSVPYTPGDQSVEGHLTGLLAADNPLMVKASTDAAQAAAARGLGNSSMALQAGQQAVINSALPIASQDASQIASNNLSRQGFEQGAGLQGQTIAGQSEMQSTALGAQDTMLREQLQNQRDIVGSQLQTQRDIAQLDETTKANIATLDVNSQQAIAGMNVGSHDKQTAISAAASAAQTYQQMFATITNNPNIPADVRDRYLAQAKTVADSNMHLIEQMYGVQLNWDFGAGGTLTLTDTAAGTGGADTIAGGGGGTVAGPGAPGGAGATITTNGGTASNGGLLQNVGDTVGAAVRSGSDPGGSIGGMPPDQASTAIDSRVSNLSSALSSDLANANASPDTRNPDVRDGMRAAFAAITGDPTNMAGSPMGRVASALAGFAAPGAGLAVTAGLTAADVANLNDSLAATGVNDRLSFMDGVRAMIDTLSPTNGISSALGGKSLKDRVIEHMQQNPEEPEDPESDIGSAGWKDKVDKVLREIGVMDGAGGGDDGGDGGLGGKEAGGTGNRDGRDGPEADA